jgi:hypothetical protein
MIHTRTVADPEQIAQFAAGQEIQADTLYAVAGSTPAPAPAAPAKPEGETPRTDAQQEAADGAFDVAGLVPADFARQLERELAAAKASKRALQKSFDAECDLRAKAEDDLAAAKAELKNLAPTGRYNGLDIEAWYQRAMDAESALRELVQLKDIHDKLADLDNQFSAEACSLNEDYQTNKPIAWAKARELLRIAEETKGEGK